MNLPKIIFVTGTDTGVGKTVVTAALAHCVSRSGAGVSVVKPVQTGTNVQSVTDIEFVYKVLDKGFDYNEHCPYSFSEPLSPKTAAEMQGIRIDPGTLVSKIQAQSERYDIVIVEGAGGLLVPIAEGYLMADLAKDLGSHVVIVTRPGLGTINHTVLTVQAAKSRGLVILGIVISNFPNTPGLSEKTNPFEIERLTGVPIIGVLYEDKTIDVEQGRVGGIRENSTAGFSPLFGGSFDIDVFLDSLK